MIHTMPYFFLFGTMHFIGLLIGFLLFVVPVMEIIHKAGYTRAWILIGLIPIVNLIFLWIFAFSRWPVLRRET